MRRLIRPTVAISVLGLGGQCVALAVQVLAASLFGARAEMDAYIAALTLPMYANTVLLGGVTYVFVPLFVRHQAAHDDAAAWQVADNIISLYVLVAGVIAAIGIVFAQPLLSLTVPGLPEPTLRLAAGLSRLLWPGVLLGGLAALWIGLYQAHERFVWPALVPVLGSTITLGLVALWGQRIGISVLAIGMLASGIAQVLLLTPILIGRYSFSLDLRDQEVREALRLLAPLVIGAMFAQGTKIIDRFVASGLSRGSISYLAYGDKITTLSAALLSGGIAVTFFPQLARDAAGGDVPALRTTASMGLRFVWLLVAPAITLGIGLAHPLVGALLQRGAFQASDTDAVATVLLWYLPALVGMCWGNITARTFYALRDTRTLSVISIVEVLMYALYTPWIGRRWGVYGIAAAVMLYWNLSITVHCVLLWKRLGRPSLWHLTRALLRIAIAAAAGGVGARLASSALSASAWSSLVVGACVGVGTYALVLHLIGAHEWRLLMTTSQQWVLRLRERLT